MDSFNQADRNVCIVSKEKAEECRARTESTELKEEVPKGKHSQGKQKFQTIELQIDFIA